MISRKYDELKAAGSLPSPKGVALAIIRLTQQDEVSMAELARAIGGDPAFVGRLIKAANGLIAFNRRPVGSVREALMVLGLPAVRSMALGFSLLSDYRKGACRGFDYDRYWSHSLLMALAMQVIAQRNHAAAPDELFSVGLLARVGELALATAHPREYAELLAECRRYPERRLVELERRTLAITHSELAGALMQDWGLPRVFVDLVAGFDALDGHVHAEGTRQYILHQSLLTARAIADTCLAANGDRVALLHALFGQAGQIGFGRDEVIADCERIFALWSDWGASLALDVPEWPSFADLVLGGTAGSGEEEVASADQSLAVQRPQPDGAGSSADAELLRMLVADSGPDTEAAVNAALHDDLPDLAAAHDARSALDKALELQPQLIVIGASFPPGEGLDLVRALRRTRIGERIYVLLLSAADSDERLVEAFDAGVDDLVVAPVRTPVFAARLRAGVRVIRLQQALEREREELRHFAAELAVTNRRLHEAALTDVLTGFRNRRYAHERMEQEWAAAVRTGRPLACMIIDFDGLKPLNDTFGHEAGDLALTQAAAALRKALRGQDVICRIGGDEFLAICPGSDLSAALKCAERLRQAVSAIALDLSSRSVPLSVSIGVAEKDRSTENPDMLMKVADRGAYLAKQRGRNGVATVQNS